MWIPSHCNKMKMQTWGHNSEKIPRQTAKSPALQYWKAHTLITSIFKKKNTHSLIKTKIITHVHAVNRLRLNSTLFTYKPNHQSKICDHCKLDNTIEHFLFHYPAHQDHREQKKTSHLSTTTLHNQLSSFHRKKKKTQSNLPSHSFYRRQTHHTFYNNKQAKARKLSTNTKGESLTSPPMQQ